jgi:hypothetical protein
MKLNCQRVQLFAVRKEKHIVMMFNLAISSANIKRTKLTFEKWETLLIAEGAWLVAFSFVYFTEFV